jgi:hypothetical protein
LRVDVSADGVNDTRKALSQEPKELITCFRNPVMETLKPSRTLRPALTNHNRSKCARRLLGNSEVREGVGEWVGGGGWPMFGGWGVNGWMVTCGRGLSTRRTHVPPGENSTQGPLEPATPQHSAGR